MIQLVIDNSESKIAGFTAEQQKVLRSILSYAEDAQSAFFSGGFGPKIKCLLDKKGHFPTGLLYAVVGYLRINSIPYETTDLRVKPATNQKLFKLNLR